MRILLINWTVCCSTEYYVPGPFAVTVRSKAWVWAFLTVEIVGSNLAENIDVHLLCCVGSCLCDELITRSAESRRVCECVSVCDRETWTGRRLKTVSSCCATGEIYICYKIREVVNHGFEVSWKEVPQPLPSLQSTFSFTRGVTLTPHPPLVPWPRKSRAKPLLPLWAVRPVQNLSACTVQLYLYSPYGPYGLYRASVPVQ